MKSNDDREECRFFLNLPYFSKEEEEEEEETLENARPPAAAVVVAGLLLSFVLFSFWHPGCLFILMQACRF